MFVCGVFVCMFVWCVCLCVVCGCMCVVCVVCVCVGGVCVCSICVVCVLAHACSKDLLDTGGGWDGN